MAHAEHAPMQGWSAQDWDQRYDEQDHIWSGDPNPVLVDEVGELGPGTALDVGCGEGADLCWLAERGWEATGVDISGVAVRRAREVVGQRGLDVDIRQVDLASEPPPAGPFDLVSLHYFAILKSVGDAPLQALLDVVAPRGHLLAVSHDITDEHQARAAEHGFDPDDFHDVRHLLDLVGDDFEVLVDEDRARTTPPPEGTHHVDDVVVHLRRR